MNNVQGTQNIPRNGLTDKPYLICNLPPNFGQVDEDGVSYITEWFNYRGLTYIAE